MHSLTKLEEVVKCQTSLPSPDCREVVQAIRHALSVDPSLIEELAPRMALFPRLMTPKEKARVSIPAMNEAKRERRKKVLEAAGPIVREVRAARATANCHEIALALNNKCDYGPAKKRETWTFADARRLLKDLGIEFKPTEN